MAATEEINRVFREFRRYTGDGMPNAPVGAPLPVGDPQSGVHNPKKSEIRAALIQVLIEAGVSVADAEAAADRAEAAADAAEAAVAGVSVTSFATRALAIASTPIVATDFIELAGYTAAGDGGGALYKKVASQPTHAGKFSITVSGSPVWYELAALMPNPYMFGAVTGENSTTALQNWWAHPSQVKALPEGNFLCTARLLSDGRHISVVGHSLSKSLITWTAANGGLLLNENSGVGANSRAAITLSNLSLVTRVAGGGTGLGMAYSDAGTIVPFGDATTLTLINVEIRGEDFYETGGNTHYWNTCMHLVDTGGVSASNLKLRGKAGTAGLKGMHIQSSLQPNIRYFLSNLQFQGFEEAVRAEAASGKPIEGIYFTNYEFIACFRGFYGIGGIINAVEFGTGHIDATFSCIENAASARGSSTWCITAGAYLQLGNKWNGSYVAGNAIILDDVNYSRIDGCYILGDPAKSVIQSGVLLRSSDHCTINGNNFHHLNVGVGMESNGVGGVCVASVVGFENTFDNVTTKVIGNGSTSFYNRAEQLGTNNTLFAANGIIHLAGTTVLTLDASGNALMNLPQAFPSAFLNARVCNGESGLAGDGSFVVNQTACTAAALSISVRPNPGAINVRVQWDAMGR